MNAITEHGLNKKVNSFDLKQRHIAKKWLSFLSKLAQSNNRRSYGRMESRDDFIDRFEELMDGAPDEVTRKKFEKLMMEMR